MKAAILLIAFLGAISTVKSQPGTLDKSFGAKGGYTLTSFMPNGSSVYKSIAMQQDGRIVAAGVHSMSKTESDFALARYNPDGSLDVNFNLEGIVVTKVGAGKSSINAVAIQQDGRIVVAGSASNGSNTDFALVRYRSNGDLDNDFGNGGVVLTDFGLDGDAVNAIAILPGGKILVAGVARRVSDNLDFALARYHSNGDLDTDFGDGGKVLTDFGGAGRHDRGRSMVVLGDGRIVVVGQVRNEKENDFAIARYLSNGTLDDTFDGDGKVVTEFEGGYDRASALAFTSSTGNIVVAGDASSDGSSKNISFGLARYLKNGALDKSFHDDGRVITDMRGENDYGASINIQEDGRIVVAGNVTVNGVSNFGITRYLSNGVLDESFDGDGKLVTSINSGAGGINDAKIKGDKLYVVGGAAGEAVIAAYHLAEPALLSVAVGKDAAEDATDGFFTISATRALTRDVSISFKLSGTTKEDADFETVSQPVILKAGQTSVKVDIKVKKDDEVEPAETVVLELASVTGEGASVDQAKKTATLKIIDNDKKQIVLSVARGEDGVEPAKAGHFIISASVAPQENLPISFNLEGGSAIEGKDFEAVGKQVVLEKGKTSAVVQIKVKDDTEVEGEETVVLELVSVTGEGATIDHAKKSATLKIQDNDKKPNPAIAVSVEAKANAKEPAQHGNFVIRLSEVLDQDLTVSFSLDATSTATEGKDYKAVNRQVLVKKGSKEAEVLIEVLDDTEVEPEETVVLMLDAPTAKGIVLDQAKKTATLKIIDNDVAPAALLSVAVGKNAAEDDTDGFFTITASKVLQKDVSIRYTISGSAGRGADYTTLPEADQVMLKAGQTSVQVQISIEDDEEVEPEETVVLELASITGEGAVIDQAKKTATLTIIDDDVLPSLSFAQLPNLFSPNGDQEIR